jgi:hypothetical protein
MDEVRLLTQCWRWLMASLAGRSGQSWGKQGFPIKPRLPWTRPSFFPFSPHTTIVPLHRHNSTAPGGPSSFLKSSSANTSTQEIPVRTFLSSVIFAILRLPAFFSFPFSYCPFPLRIQCPLPYPRHIDFFPCGDSIQSPASTLAFSKMLSSLLFAESPLRNWHQRPP